MNESAYGADAQYNWWHSTLVMTLY